MIRKLILILGILHAAMRLKSLARAQAGDSPDADAWLVAASGEQPEITKILETLERRLTALIALF